MARLTARCQALLDLLNRAHRRVDQDVPYATFQEPPAAAATAAADRMRERLAPELTDDVDQLRATIRHLAENCAHAETERDQVYRERAHLLTWIAGLLPTGAAILTQAPPEDTDNNGWPLLYIHTRGHQLSWHINPRDLDVMDRIPWVPASDKRAQWDGHTTPQKHLRIKRIVAELWSECGPSCGPTHAYDDRCAYVATLGPHDHTSHHPNT